MSQILKYTGTRNQIEMNADVCNEIQAADIQSASMQSLVSGIIESHVQDSADMTTSAPIFLALMEQAATAFLEFENKKQEMIHSVSIDKGYILTDWNLDYETHELSYAVEKAGSETVITFPVSDDICSGLQMKQALHTVANGVITNIVNEHLRDASTSILKSATYAGFSTLTAKYLQEFNNAKESMFRSVVPVNQQAVCGNWNLDYASRTLTCYVK